MLVISYHQPAMDAIVFYLGGTHGATSLRLTCRGMRRAIDIPQRFVNANALLDHASEGVNDEACRVAMRSGANYMTNLIHNSIRRPEDLKYRLVREFNVIYSFRSVFHYAIGFDRPEVCLEMIEEWYKDKEALLVSNDMLEYCCCAVSVGREQIFDVLTKWDGYSLKNVGKIAKLAIAHDKMWAFVWALKKMKTFETPYERAYATDLRTQLLCHVFEYSRGDEYLDALDK